MQSSVILGFLLDIILSSLIIVVPSSSATIQNLKDGDFELETPVIIYVRKWSLLLVLNVTK